MWGNGREREARRGLVLRSVGIGTSSWARALLAVPLVVCVLASAAASDGGPAPVTVVGRLQLLVVESFSGHPLAESYEILALDPAAGSLGYRLEVGPDLQVPEVGSLVRVSGILSSDGTLRAKRLEVLRPADSAGDSESHHPAANYNMLVMLLNYSDYTFDDACNDGLPSTRCCTLTGVDDTVFLGANSVAAYYHENSFHQVNLQGDVAGPFTTSVKRSRVCNSLSKAANEGDSAAASAGYTLSSYTHKFYVLPDATGTTCNVSGTAIPCSNRAWAVGACGDHVFAHEWGHDLGMNHAGVPGDEYGDFSDSMGASGGARPGGAGTLRHNNAPHKMQMLWLPDNQSSVQIVQTSGIYTVHRLEDDGLGVQVLRIPQVFTQGTDKDYFISYRRRIGFDLNLRDEFEMTTSIHKFDSDLGLGGPCGAAKTTLVGLIGDGQTFQDVANGITVSQLSHDDFSATVQVTFSGP